MNNLELLVSRLRQWQRWTNLHKAVYYGVRGLVFGILGSAIVAVFLILSARLMLSEYFDLLFTSGILGLLIAFGIAFFWPQSQLKSARSYDRVFDLKERVSTAIELSQQEQVEPSWRELQLADALEATRQIAPKDRMKWYFPKLEVGILLFASILILGSWVHGRGAFQRAEINAKNQQLIETETKHLEALISDVENNGQLSAETKEAVTSPLKESLQKMNQADSLEEAASALSQAQQMLKELSSSNSEDFTGLQSAGKELAKNQESPLSSVGEALSQGNLQAAAENLAALDLSKLNPQELASLSGQLTDMSAQLEASSPDLANQLQQAAKALQDNDMQSAQEAIANASTSLADSAQRAEIGNTARKSSEALAESQGRLMAAAMFGASSAQSASAQSSSNQSPENEQNGSFGSQAGSGGFEESNIPGKEAGLTPLTQNNTPGASSEKKYDSVYFPQRLGGTPETNLSLGSSENSASSAIGSVGSSTQQNAQSLVPYSEIFSSYKGGIDQALESGVIPLPLQPLIRDYFSSLNPR